MNILKFIPYGRENAISQDELATRTGIKDKRVLRQYIFNARCAGEIICSTCDGNNGGYYRPNTCGEAVLYYRMQKSRIESACKALMSVEEYIKAGFADE